MCELLILEWFSKCEQFMKNNESQHEWNEEKCLYIMWRGIASTKYLNSALIEKFLEILPKLTNQIKSFVCFVISKNPALTIDMILSYPDLAWNFYEISKNMNIKSILAHPELKWDWHGVSCNDSD